MKKGLILLFFLATLIYFSIGIFALTFNIQSSCTGDKTLMKLSDSTNAHGELWNGPAYTSNYVCSDSAESPTCEPDGSNKVLGLSAPTNAHAEIPDGIPVYDSANDVCYGDLECISTTDSSCDTTGGTSEGYPISVLSLSADTNAHIGPFNAYGINICCADVPPIQLPPPCTLDDAYWSLDNVNPTRISQGYEALDGQPVYLVVEGTQACNGLSMSFNVWEDETAGDNLVTTNLAVVTFLGSRAKGTWTSEYQDDGFLQGNPEYYFIGTTEEGDTIDSQDFGELLTVVEQTVLSYCMGKNLCSDIPDENYCTTSITGENSPCSSISANSVPDNNNGNPIVDCTDSLVDCFCEWDTPATRCDVGWDILQLNPIPNDGAISPGETCDGTNLVGLSCNNFDSFTGGSLSCDSSSHFNTLQCTGGISGTIGDGVVNPGEECEGNDPLTGDWGTIEDCFDFGFSGGTLRCYAPGTPNQGKFDTTSCTGGSTPVLGRCSIHSSGNDNCDDGILSYSWTAEWTGTGDRPASCPTETQSRTLSCPAQIQLPFFDLYNFLISALVIGLIYFLLNLKGKTKKRKHGRK